MEINFLLVSKKRGKCKALMWYLYAHYNILTPIRSFKSKPVILNYENISRIRHLLIIYFSTTTIMNVIGRRPRRDVFLGYSPRE